jgi:serine/threonine protein kinase
MEPAIEGFCVEKKITTSGQCTAYLVRRSSDQQTFFLKWRKEEEKEEWTKKGAKRFDYEAKVLKSLKKCSYFPDLVSVVNDNLGVRGLIVTYYPLQTLHYETKHRTTSWTVPETLQLGDHLCSALSYVHRRQHVHRDVKPKNILVSPDLTQVVIVDFGIAYAKNVTQTMTLPDDPIGNRFCPCPEQRKLMDKPTTPLLVHVRSRRDPRTDVTQACCVLYYMLHAVSHRKNEYRLHDTASAFDVQSLSIPPKYAHIISVLEKGLRSNLDERFQNAEDLKLALRHTPTRNFSGGLKALKEKEQVAVGHALGQAANSEEEQKLRQMMKSIGMISYYKSHNISAEKSDGFLKISGYITSSRNGQIFKMTVKWLVGDDNTLSTITYNVTVLVGNLILIACGKQESSFHIDQNTELLMGWITENILIDANL